MCVGIPMLIMSIDGIAGQADDGETVHLVDLSLTPDVQAGQWVLTFLGAAREIIGADEAARIGAALAGLRSLMAGGELGDAFADLEKDGPQLPPHLQAALASGRNIA